MTVPEPLYDYRFACGNPGDEKLPTTSNGGDWSNCESVTRAQIHQRIDEVLDSLDSVR